MGVAITYSGGSPSFGFTANAAIARGNADGKEVSWSNSHVNAGNTLTIESGGDTNLKGATASGKQVVADVGGKPLLRAMSGRSKDMQSLLLPGGKWTPHDLRRSAATLMGESRVMPHIIELCLNHKEENRVKRTYQRQRSEDAQR